MLMFPLYYHIIITLAFTFLISCQVFIKISRTLKTHFGSIYNGAFHCTGNTDKNDLRNGKHVIWR